MGVCFRSVVSLRVCSVIQSTQGSNRPVCCPHCVFTVPYCIDKGLVLANFSLGSFLFILRRTGLNTVLGASVGRGRAVSQSSGGLVVAVLVLR